MDDSIKQRMATALAHSRWDSALVGLELIEAAGGKARMRLPVEDPVTNLGGALHGGAIATLVDVAGTVAILTQDRDHRAGVSTDLNVSFFAPGKKGSAVIALAEVLKVGRTLAFVTVDVRREADGVLVAQGRMTKHLG